MEQIIQKIYCYAQYGNTTKYRELMIQAMARAILENVTRKYEAVVLVDGLTKFERRRVVSGLRHLNVKVRKVRGVNDQSSSIMRLADVMAGFVRSGLEHDERFVALWNQALKSLGIKRLP
jgi:ribosome maturation protein Sdo1